MSEEREATTSNSVDPDAAMTDISEQGRPPGDPPDVPGSWVQKVVGGNIGGRLTPEKVLDEAFVTEKVHLTFPDGEDGEPEITIEREVLEAMNGLWKRCMIVKVLDRNIPIAVLNRKLWELWNPSGSMSVIDLPRQFFMVRFELEEEYLSALTGGPWRAFGSHLMVQAWTPEFEPLRDEIVTTPVWVRLSNIPVNFYHRSILMGIARGLGKPIRVDPTTLIFERARFARVCVEVNLTKPLKGTVMVNGERYFVAYEGLSNICSSCGIYGHLVHNCPKVAAEKAKNATPVGVTEVVRGSKPVDDGFTVVRRSGRRPANLENRVGVAAGPPVTDMGRNLQEIPENIMISNRFGGLEEDMVTTEMREVTILAGGDKENVNQGNIQRKGKSTGQGSGSSNGAKVTRNNSGPRDVLGTKRAAGNKSNVVAGPKTKQKNINRPARGLVFGPTREEVVLSESGKRLRVENRAAGRLGGVFAGEGDHSMINARHLQSDEVEDDRNPMATAVVSPQNESEKSRSPQEEEAGMTEAYMMKKFPTDMLAVFETHAGGEAASRICRGLGFENSFRVDAAGQSGGLWLLWRNSVGTVVVEESSDQFIYATVTNGTEKVHVIAVYAAPTVTRRSGLWGQLTTVIQNVDGPLIIGGDFNTIIRVDERTGGSGRLSTDSLAFGEWCNNLSLIDMGFRGNKFTWRRGKEESTFVAKRLDRILCCPQARLQWQEAIVSHLPFLSSDHAPLYIQLCPESKGDPRRRPFRFEAAWMKHESFKELLNQSWNGNIRTPDALKKLRDVLKRWNKDVFGDVHKRKEQLVSEIKIVQDALELNQTDDLLKKEEELIKEFEVVLEQEEVLWFQKSREKWVVLGDRNTTYFHTSTIIRRRRNRIEALKGDDGRWLTSPPELEELAVNYYKRLYSMEDVDSDFEQLPSVGFTRLPREELQELSRPYTKEDVEKAVRSMGQYKAPGPDGFQPGFYQHCWDVVGCSVTKFVLDFFATSNLPEETNDALVVLIAKVEKPERITQFRPISLCNVLFKTITKAMVMRLKRVMPTLIGPAQSSFIPGRLSTDNIVLVQEAVHSMRRKKGRKGWMLLKLDLEKAYDRIRWDFLEDTLTVSGLPEKYVGWIMQCVKGPSMNVLWNGEKTETFKPSRGLRQGDPLSPYLFVLCLERLCHLIELAVDSKEWKAISLSCGGPKLSHICFADDLILFAEASVTQIRVIRKVLEKFCKASGQKVSLEKSKIFFSNNVHRDLAKLISDESGIKSTKDLGKYLGMPVLQKRINKDTYGELLEKVNSRLSGWKGRFLSFAGRFTLTKAVIGSIPIHSMGTISLPASVLDGLDKAARSFLWGSSAEQKKQHLIAWDRVCAPKYDGGLGIKSAKHMNKAMLAKLGWRLLQDRGSLWAKVLRHKYKVGEVKDPRWLVTKGSWSSTWRSVGSGLREAVIPGLSWVLGDGKDGRGWDFTRIRLFISPIVKLQLAARVVDNVTGAVETSDGQFTVKSAYNLLTRDETPRQWMGNLFKRVWRVRAPERVRMFLWLVVNQAIMTNVERHRRHLSDSGLCQVCKGGEETIIHVLRDCPAMEGIWQRLLPPRSRQPFFAKSILEWVYANLGEEREVAGSPWSTCFAMTVWWGWKWRCGNVFNSNGKCRDRLRFLKELAKEVSSAFLFVEGSGRRAMREERLIAWKPPGDDWIKLNTDGASQGNPGKATAGGVLRDSGGNWRGGFALNIGVCSAPLAELWGVYYGLYIAWERGFTRLELEVDSEIVVGFLKTGISDSHPLSFLVRLCYGFISRD
ncbi:Endonuclease/exonuclease/phosphatase superfamily [Arabidopsis suecica]|uniref:Endonuclease/exonuclease/phosphatase superfamily n=1 Tax=Arabidopsis suecica TaxID=45249 RepID=A0A8T2CMP2_ARASU|nr:Endonuclease/exonuclease/phosphatase superfamily [Arabidopsis suecica]